MKTIMNKIFTILILSFFTLGNANAEVSIGATGTLGMLSADGKETISGATGGVVEWGPSNPKARSSQTETAATSEKDSEEIFIGYGSIFAEAHIFSTGLRAGMSYVPYGIESETTENKRNDNCSQAEAHLSSDDDRGLCAETVNKVQVELKNLSHLYLSYHRDMFFVKAGVITADIETHENLTSGSSYEDTTLEGQFVGVGIEKDFRDDMFFRTEVNVSQFDDLAIAGTGSDNTTKVEITGLGGVTGAISVGRTF
jgi:hypothetical protein